MSLIATGPSPTRPWPADRVEHWPIEGLIAYANNPRVHSEADLDKIAASIGKWGWTNPALVDERGVLIAGNGRVAAAARLELKSIPVIVNRGDYHWKHECCSYAVRRGKKSHWQGDRTQTTVWEITNNNPFGNRHREQSWGHGTQKPVECWQAFTGRTAIHQASGQSFDERAGSQDRDRSGSADG
jgi:hypothetical protein